MHVSFWSAFVLGGWMESFLHGSLVAHAHSPRMHSVTGVLSVIHDFHFPLALLIAKLTCPRTLNFFPFSFRICLCLIDVS